MIKNILKNNLKKFLLISIVVLLILTLVPYMGFDYQNIINNPAKDKKWITVGDKTVSDTMILQEYNQSLQQYANDIAQNPEILTVIFNNILEKYITTLLYANEAENIGLTISKEELYKMIANLPQLQGENGEFSRSNFNNIVNSYFGSEELFLEFMKTSVLQDQLMSSVLSSIKQPNYLAYLDFLAISQERTIKYITLTNNLIKTPLNKATETDLQALLTENKDFFTSPETKSADIFYLDDQAINSMVKVNKEEIKNYYENNSSQFTNPEKREVIQLIFNSKEEALKVYENIKNVDINTVQKDNKFVNMGYVDNSTFALEPEINKTIFSAQLNTIQQPVKSSLGWHIFVVLNITPSSIKPLASVEKEIYSEVFLSNKTLLKNSLKKQIQDMLKAKQSLSEIAKKLSGNVVSLNNINENSKINNKTISQDIKETIFNLKSIKNSDVLEDQNGTFYVVNITNLVPSKLQTIQEAKTKLEQLWLEKQQSEELTKLKDKIVLELSSGKNINSLGYATKSVKISRISKDVPPFNTETNDALLKAQKNNVIKGNLTNNETIVAVIDSITNVKEPYLINGSINPKIETFIRATNGIYITLFLEQYSKKLVNKFKVFVNNKAIQNRFTQASNGQQ